MDIGTHLREAREEKGISLDSLQETTKIQKRYLVAIEEGNFHLLPGRFYAKAFIKEYANAVGIEADGLIELYERTAKDEENDDASEYTQVKQTPLESSSNKMSSSLFPRIMVFLLIFGIIIAAVYFYKKTADSNSVDPLDDQNDQTLIRNESNQDTDENILEDEEDSDADEVENDESEDVPEESTGNVEFNVTTVGSGSTPHSIIEVSGVEYPFEVGLIADGNTWVTLKDEHDKSYIREELSEEESPVLIEVENSKELQFVIGNASLLTIEINGEKLDYPVDPVSKVYQKITLEMIE